jgi:cell cycle serine/threonine-protein kinase CDC5/MSD2
MAQSLVTPSSSNTDLEQIKFVQRLVDKLKYCKEVLVSIRTASISGNGIPEESDAMGSALVAGGTGNGGMMTGSATARTAKVALR